MSGAKNTVSIGAILGASGSGKSSLMKLELLAEQPTRLLVWDPKREYGAIAPPVPGDRNSPSSLEELMRKVFAGGTFRLSFRPVLSRKPMRAQFNAFCLAAERAGNCFVVVDELADVTEPGWAPEGWERLTRQGRHAGLTIRGASQRPAEIDKSFLGNASRIACFRMNAEGDVKLLARILGKPDSEIRELAPLEWFERDMLTGQVTEKKRLDPRALGAIPA